MSLCARTDDVDNWILNAVENANDISIPIAITAMVVLQNGDIIYSIRICSCGLNVGYRDSKASYNLIRRL